jgi:hypothetical protein
MKVELPKSVKNVFIISLLLLSLLLGLRMQRRVNLPQHLLGHKSLELPNFVRADVAAELMALIKEMRDFPTNANDLKFYDTVHEHIGEAVPISEHGRCDMHPYFVPNSNRTMCILPGRVDVGRHFVKHGGVIGLKESYERLVSRVQSFGRYMYDLQEYPLVERLFESAEFLDAAKAVCPPHRQVLDPFQFNFIMQVPGQTVALHLDAPYFWGATRFQFPQWLLVTMVFSGLFESEFIDQVQVVGYLHRWEDERDGKFVYWNSDDLEEKHVPPTPLGGSVVDGSKTVHAAMIYRPEVVVPFIDKSADTTLRYVDGDNWTLESSGRHVANYTTDDLRITIVYRARCFGDSGEVKRFYAQQASGGHGEGMMQLDDVLAKLSAELVARGRVASVEAALAMRRVDLALLLMDEFISYPLPTHSVNPYNYCALPRLFPSLAPLLSYLCPIE